MHLHKPTKVDLYHECPCPCRRRGSLVPIVLTEAFGCNRCQQLFIFDEKNQEIEQVTSIHPYKRLWYWTGYRWQSKPAQAQNGQLVGLIFLSSMFFLGWIILAARASFSLSVILGIIILATLLFFFMFTLWLAYRR